MQYFQKTPEELFQIIKESDPNLPIKIDDFFTFEFAESVFDTLTELDKSFQEYLDETHFSYKKSILPIPQNNINIYRLIAINHYFSKCFKQLLGNLDWSDFHNKMKIFRYKKWDFHKKHQDFAFSEKHQDSITYGFHVSFSKWYESNSWWELVFYDNSWINPTHLLLPTFNTLWIYNTNLVHEVLPIQSIEFTKYTIASGFWSF